MALPPDPIDEVLPAADAAVIAEVTQILHTGTQTFVPQFDDPGTVDIPRDLPEQTIELRVKQILFGSLAQPNSLIQVKKPAGDYVLRAGVEGPYLLAKRGEHIEILGRYGPDSYSTHVLKAAIQKHNRT